MGTQHDELTWGGHVNIWPSTPPAPPTWADEGQQAKWTTVGLVLWENSQQRILHLTPAFALELLHSLEADQAWQVQGTVIAESAIRFQLPAVTGKRTHEEDEPEVETPVVSVSELQTGGSQAYPLQTALPGTTVVDSLLIPPVQAQQMFALLRAHKLELQKLAEATEQIRASSLQRARAYIFETSLLATAHQIDLTARPLPWSFDKARKTWSCDAGPNRGTIFLDAPSGRFTGCIERPGQFKETRRGFGAFERALAWVEQQLQEDPKPDETLQTKRPHPPRLSLATLTPDHRARLAPYWIEPTTLVPSQVTYQAVIDLIHIPTAQKAMELSFGEKLYYDEKYPTVLQLVKALKLDPNTIEVSNLLEGQYWIMSLATFAEATAAEALAQRWWEQSAIAAAFRDGKIIRAAYGVWECETGFKRWISWYGKAPDQQLDRSAYLADQALGVALSYALDVDGYRAWRGLQPTRPTTVITDNDLLADMHTARVSLAHIPPAARAESQVWLDEHDAKLLAARRKRR